MADSQLPSNKPKRDDRHRSQQEAGSKATRPHDGPFLFVIVGLAVIVEEEQPGFFPVNKDLICNNSGHVKRLCDDKTPGDSSPIILPSVQPTIFLVYFQWITSHGADLKSKVADLSSGTDGDLPADIPEVFKIWSKVLTWCELWALGQLLEDKKFTDEVVRVMLEFDFDVLHAFIIQGETVNHVAGKAEPGTGLWRWLVDVVVAVVEEQDIKVLAKSWQKDICLAVLSQLVARKSSRGQNNTPTPTDFCKYKA